MPLPAPEAGDKAGPASFDQAVGLLTAHVDPLGVETVELAEAAGRVLAEVVHASSAAPRCAVAAMDGYAVRDATTRAGEPLRVIGESRAGCAFPGRVADGEAVRIFTGAPLPAGADRCIVQEHASHMGDTVVFTEGYGPAWHVREAGSDFAAGDQLLARGTLISSRTIIAAAAADAARLTVAVRPRVAIIGTGDELAVPGSVVASPHIIPDTVTFGVATLVEEAGGAVVRRTLAGDDLPALRRLAGAALAEADVVVVTGGGSVGARDFAKPMFSSLGLEPVFSQVAIKPGKPVWLGRARGRWVLGLPGNPGSALVTATLFLRPLLALLQGRPAAAAWPWRRLPLAAALPPTGGRETFVRAAWEPGGLVSIACQDSAAQLALSQSDWLIRCAAGQDALAAGAMVSALAL